MTGCTNTGWTQQGPDIHPPHRLERSINEDQRRGLRLGIKPPFFYCKGRYTVSLLCLENLAGNPIKTQVILYITGVKYVAQGPETARQRI